MSRSTKQRRASPPQGTTTTDDLPVTAAAALRWLVRFVYESKNVAIRESQAVLILLAAIPANRLAAAALAALLSRRGGPERTCEVLVAWARAA
jgi:hypothetical protein